LDAGRPGSGDGLILERPAFQQPSFEFRRGMILSNINPSILFVNPSLGTKRYAEEDKLRSYLSLGTLAGALRNRAFLKRFAVRLGKKEIIFNSESDYPDFDIFF
jgi:hypothetical protein